MISAKHSQQNLQLSKTPNIHQIKLIKKKKKTNAPKQRKQSTAAMKQS